MIDSSASTLDLGTIVSKDSDFFSSDQNEGGTFRVNADIVATGRTCVIGSSGSGKSYTVGVICEELCKSRVPFVIIDIEGEYSGLKEKYEAVWVGDDEKSDLKWNKVDLKLLAQYAPDCPPLILDLSETDKPREKVGAFLLAIYREISKRRTPYLVILEEADRFAPQVGERLAIFDEVARRGRKRGLGLMLCTQRPSLVDKNILSQCSNQFIGKLVIKNDLQSVAQFFSSHGLPNQLTSLSSGEFFALGGLSGEGVCVKIRKRETRHGGITPKLNPQAVHASVDKILAALSSGDSFSAPTEVTVLEVDSPPVQQEKTEVEASIASTPHILALQPLIELRNVPSLVKLEKSYGLFGQKENVAAASLVFRPLAKLGVRIRTGLIKKKFETMFFILDAMTGQVFESKDRLSFKDGVERLLGLEQEQVTILKLLHPDKDMSLIELSAQSGLEDNQLRRFVKGLEDQRLVRSVKIGRAKLFRRMVDFPKIELTKEYLFQFQEMDPSSSSEAFVLKPKITEEQVRPIVRGMWDGADLESFLIFYYPLYHASLVLNSRSRSVDLDARTGKELQSR